MSPEPKTYLVNRMNSIAPNSIGLKNASNKTVKELIEWFVANNPNKVGQLIQELGGENLDDDYLKGIIDRNKG